MPRYLIQHQHRAEECGAAYAAWKGFDSPLRNTTTFASCLEGEHAIWWQIEASDAGSALALLPPYLAARATALRVSEVAIP